MFLALTFAAHAVCAEWLKTTTATYDQQTYISIPLDFSALAPLRARAEALAGVPLKNRGEAHLTVVTPPEMKRLSAPVRTRLVKALARTPPPLKPVCLGVGHAGALGTYYVVVEAPALKKLRRAAGLRQPFHPHVTLGFTERDLHEVDGVTKDAGTCAESV